MRRFLIATALGMSLLGRAAAQQPGEVVLTPYTFADESRALQAKDAFTRTTLLRVYKTLFEIDLDSAADRERFAKEYAVYRAFKDSFGCYRLNFMSNSRLAVRPGAPAGGSVAGYVRRSQVGLDAAGQKDPLLSEERELVYLFITGADGVVPEPNKNPMELQLDPKKTQSITCQCTTQIGYGLYNGRPATGQRDDAQVWLPNRGDLFTNVSSEDFAKKIRWLGPVRQFNLRVTLDNQGNWSWRDESMGIDLKGKIAD